MKQKVILILILICIAFPMTVSAADTAYYSYTYDEWGNPVSGPCGYEPEAVYSGLRLGVGDFKSPTDIAVDKDNQVYICDTGNNRIVIADSELKKASVLSTVSLGGIISELKQPTGIYVSDNGLLYIADTGNNRVVICDREGNMKRQLQKPKAAIFPQERDFIPERLIADSTGTVYVTCSGIYNGAVIFSPKGEFLGFFGSNRVELSVALLVDKFWKSILPQQAKSKLSQYIPTEFTSLDIDNEDFVYTCTVNTNDTSGLIRKINPMGINILQSKVAQSFQGSFGDLGVAYYNSQMITTRFTDISVDSNGFITALDTTRGRIFQYDRDANLMFVFGGLGNRKGLFRAVTAIDNYKDGLLVLDKGTNSITLFTLTKFGTQVHKAIGLFNDGLYSEAVKPWTEVLKYDSNYNLAYIGIGKALLEAGDNEKAMEYFKTGHYAIGYNAAFNEYRSAKMRSFFPVLFAIAVIGILFIYTKNLRPVKNTRARLKKSIKKLMTGKKNLSKGGYAG